MKIQNNKTNIYNNESALRMALGLLLLITMTLCQQTKIECPIIGIDLGTTYSAVGVFKNGRVEILSNELGSRITPSVVAFTDDERLIGEAAKNQAASNPSRTIYDAKRLIGRSYNDKTIQSDTEYLPYQIVDRDSKPYIRTKLGKDKTKDFSPEEISAMVLSKMKEVAENSLGMEVKNVVVTVPAYFNDAQRQATKDAGTIAGLNVVRIINEPTAAAIAYGLDKKNQHKEETNILVYDLGGGTFDVSILTIDGGVFEVISTSGDTHLGGQDFDQRVMKYLSDQFKKKTGIDASKDKRAQQKLKREVEKAKRQLSSVSEVSIEIENFIGGKDLEEMLTRAKFEELNSDLFKKTLKSVELALKDAEFKKTDIDEIVLVGGSTRIPKIQKMIKEYFDGKEPNKSINPDEAVAYGAAVQGAIICGDQGADANGLLILDQTPLTLGIETMGGVMAKLMPRGTTIPSTKKQVFTTTENNQQQVVISVFEGERKMVKDNHKIGTFELGGISKKPRGQAQIEVSFSVDENSILTVTAKDLDSEKQETLTISNESTKFSQDEINRMIKEAQEFEEEDRKMVEKIEARHNLEHYLKETSRQLEDEKDGSLGKKLSEEDVKTIKEAITEGENWKENNNEASKEDFEHKLKEIESICAPLISKAMGHNQGKNSGGDKDDGPEFDPTEI